MASVSRRLSAALASAGLREERRPGIEKLCALIKAEHPDWDNHQLIQRAKVLWTSERIIKEKEDGTVELVPNEHYRGASVRGIER